MTDEKKKRIAELETELAPLMVNLNTPEERRDAVKQCASDYYTGKLWIEMDRDEYDALCEYMHQICDLAHLYNEQDYTPDEDEKEVSFLFRDGMTTEEKLKALANASWYANHSGYCDAMANRLMAGQSDAETDRWERLCKHKYAIDRYYNWLKEQSES